jgi:hypothetical protein
MRGDSSLLAQIIERNLRPHLSDELS